MRAKQQVSIIGGQPLTLEEIAGLDHERGIKAPGIKNIRQTHHNLARLLALGTRDGAAATMCGLSASRVSILKGDPTFQALLAVYQQEQDLLVTQIMEKVHEVGSLALEELRDRILDQPESITNGQLLEIATGVLDRLGHGPTQKVAVAHVDLSNVKAAAQLARADQITFRQEFTLSPDGGLSARQIEVDAVAAQGDDL